MRAEAGDWLTAGAAQVLGAGDPTEVLILFHLVAHSNFLPLPLAHCSWSCWRWIGTEHLVEAETAGVFVASGGL